MQLKQLGLLFAFLAACILTTSAAPLVDSALPRQLYPHPVVAYIGVGESRPHSYCGCLNKRLNEIILAADVDE